MQGSAIRRIGHLQWLRNLAIAMGNAPYSTKIIDALEKRLHLSSVLDVHIEWALEQQRQQLEKITPALGTQQQRLIRIIEKGLPRDA